MALYVELEDVTARYLGGTLDSAWLQTAIDDAEQLLFTHVERLRTDASDTDVHHVKYVVSQAVIRVANNPRGLRSESIEEQSYTLASSPEQAGALYFKSGELRRFARVRRRGVASIRTTPLCRQRST